MLSSVRLLIRHTAPLVLATVMTFLWATHDGWTGSMPGVGFFSPETEGASPLRLGILETDFWVQNLNDGRLQTATRFPPRDRWALWWAGLRNRPHLGLSLMHGTDFTPAAYLAQVESLAKDHPGVYDVLLYYGGWRPSPTPHGLNFNSWTLDELNHLRTLNARPFVGLETFDRSAIRLMVRRLAAAGYSPHDPLFVRIAAEPSTAPYGSETGKAGGAQHTARAHALYRIHFEETAQLLRALARRHRLDIRIVFAGDCRGDFQNFVPSSNAFDLVGLDLYVTPANHDQKMELLQEVSKRWPKKPLVLAELGIATAGRGAGPAWARDALADVLERIGRHPAGAAQITVFSVDVAARLTAKRWSWAWTPAMYQMLSEWQSRPHRWQGEGFHCYDLSTYPDDRDVRYHQSATLKLYYRRSRVTTAVGDPIFRETLFRQHNGKLEVVQRQVALVQGALISLEELPDNQAPREDVL